MLCQPNSLRGIALAFQRKSIFVKVARRLYGSLSPLPTLLDGSLSNSFLLLLQSWQCLQGISKVSAEKEGLPQFVVVRCIGGKYETIGNGLVVGSRRPSAAGEGILAFLFLPKQQQQAEALLQLSRKLFVWKYESRCKFTFPQKVALCKKHGEGKRRKQR